MLEKPPFFDVETTDIETIYLMLKTENEDILQKIQDDYLYWDKVKYKKTNLPAEKLWELVKRHRFIKSKFVKFGNYQFSYVITDYVQKKLHFFDMYFGGILGSNIGIADTDKNKFIISSLIEESISSSQMEGANTTRQKAKEMIQQQKKPKNKSEQMIFNNFLAMKYIVANKEQEISLENFLYLHKLLTNDTLDNELYEGKLRDTNDIYVVNYSNSEVVHTPPCFTEISDLLDDLFTFFNKEDKNFIHPILKACILHFMLGWIHPFVDGNGRTARAIFYWYMLKKGYWLTEYLTISKVIKNTKNQYEKAYLYTEIDNNDLSYFITYHIKAMEKSFEELKQYIAKKQKQVKQSAQFLKIGGVNERMAEILKIFNDDSDRIMTIKEVESRFQVSNYTARTDLKTLSEMGFLEIIQVNKKKQNFIKSDNFDLIIKELLSKK
ncbi:cell filamentation protein Fic [Capnocytophaga canimorsus]|uniref:Cell filamentation protein Fic n=1 Tax=Capnocytophaga canimorsus TaxID=28188 RepID=A0A250G3T5_9FLAO|nr:Fic family protein [Capnocytophaga canimorsus]ATA91994.1 cell filamentation protein Fic [Capnocytophaga canimorsus]